MRKLLIVCLGILLAGCGKDKSVDQEKDGGSVASFRQFAIGHMGEVSCVAFSPDGRLLAAGTAELEFPAAGVVKVWHVATGQELATLGEVQGPAVEWSRSDKYVWSLAFSPDAKTLASGSTLGANVWDVTSGQELRRLPGYGRGLAEVFLVGFSPDGKTLATASHQGVKLWNVSTW